MSSRILSQIFDRNNNASIYETLREHDEAAASYSDLDDLEERAGMRPATVQEDTEASYMDDDESTFQLQQRPPNAESSMLEPSARQHRYFPALTGPRDARFSASRRYNDDDDGSEVPQSLLFEPSKRATSFDGGESTPGLGNGNPGPSTTARRREQWDAATVLADKSGGMAGAGPGKLPPPQRLGSIQPKERAMWKWANVENLDNFLHDVGLPYVDGGRDMLKRIRSTRTTSGRAFITSCSRGS